MADVKKHKGASIYAVFFATAVVIFLIIIFVGRGATPAKNESSAGEEAISESAGFSHVGAFDICGRVVKYASKTWWEAFSNKVREHLTESQITSLDERFEGCLTLDGTLFVGLVPDGEFVAKDSKIFRYEPVKDNLVVLDFNDAVDDRAFNVTAFWRRVGDYINVSAEAADAGSGIRWDARYYFDRNEVELTRECVTELESTECIDL